MPQQLGPALVRIFSTGDIPVGAGVLVDSRSVLTCAHVVREALSPRGETPTTAPDGEIGLDFPFIAPGQYLTARVNAELWDSSRDLAVLHFTDTLPGGAIPQAFLDLTAAQLVGHKFRVRGFPGDARDGAGARGIIGDKVGDGCELEREGELHLIEPGFSGSPVWDETSGGVVGIVNRTLEATRADLGYMIPLEVIREFWAEVPTRPLSETRQAPFMVEPLPDGFVDRPAEFEPLVKALIDTIRGTAAITAALKGAGGYGKTTLARAICHDLRVRNAFNDGILWVELGETVSESKLLDKVLDLIRELTGARPILDSPESAARKLRTAIGDRHVLVVVDDAWETEHVEPFRNLGKNAATLITTRIDSILPTGSVRQNLDAMDADEALALLRYRLPAGEDATLSALATRLGNWPMLLNLANKALYDQTEHDETLLNALHDVNQALDDQGFEALNDPENADQRHSAVSATLGLSFRRLEDTQRKHFEQLAIFPEDVAIPLTALEKLWNTNGLDLKKTCKRFADLSLLLVYDLKERVIRLHDVMRTYLRDTHKADLPGWNKALLDGYNPDGTPWSEVHNDGYLYDHLIYHLSLAGQDEAIWQLFISPEWLYARRTAGWQYYRYLADIEKAKQVFQTFTIEGLPYTIGLSFLEQSIRKYSLGEVPTKLLILLIALGYDLNREVLPLALNIPNRLKSLDYLKVLWETLFGLSDLENAEKIFRVMLDMFAHANVADLDGPENYFQWAKQLAGIATQSNIFDQRIFDILTSFRHWKHSEYEYQTMRSFCESTLRNDYHKFSRKYFTNAEILIKALLDELPNVPLEKQRAIRAEYLTNLGIGSARSGDFDTVERLIADIDSLGQSSDELRAEYVESLSGMFSNQGPFRRLKAAWTQIEQAGLETRIREYIQKHSSYRMDPMASISYALKQATENNLPTEEETAEVKELENNLGALRNLYERRFHVFIWKGQFDNAILCLERAGKINKFLQKYRQTLSLSSLETILFSETPDFKQDFDSRAYRFVSASNYEPGMSNYSRQMGFILLESPRFENVLLTLAKSNRFDLLNKIAAFDEEFLQFGDFYPMQDYARFVNSFNSLISADDLKTLDYSHVRSDHLSPQVCAYSYLIFKLASEGQVDEARKVLELWQTESESAKSSGTEIQIAFGQGLALSAGPEAAATYLRENVRLSSWSFSGHILIAAKSLLVFKGAGQAEAFLIPSKENTASSGWIRDRGEEEMFLALAGYWSTQMSPLELANKAADYQKLGIAKCLESVVDIAQEIFFVDEQYANNFLQAALALLIPPPKVSSDFRKRWGMEIEDEQSVNEQVRGLNEIIGQAIDNEAAASLVRSLNRFRRLTDSDHWDRVYELIILIHNQTTWLALFLVVQRNETSISRARLEEMLRILHLFDERIPDKVGMKAYGFIAKLAMCIYGAYQQPDLYAQLRHDLERDVDTLLPELSISQMSSLIAELAAGEMQLDQIVQLTDRYVTQFFQTHKDNLWNAEIFTAQKIQAYLAAYACITAQSSPERALLLKERVIGSGDLILLIQLYKYYFDLIDKESAAIVLESIVEIARATKISERPNGIARLYRQNLNYPPPSQELQTPTFEVDQDKGTFGPGSKTVDREEQPEKADGSERVLEGDKLYLFKAICALLIVKGDWDGIQRILSAFNDPEGVFDDLREAVTLPATRLPGMHLLYRIIYEAMPVDLNLAQWPHSVLLSEATRCENGDDFLMLFSAIQETVGEGMQECLRAVVKNLKLETIAAVVGIATGKTHSQLDSLSRGLILACAIQTIVERQIKLKVNLRGLVDLTFQLIEEFKEQNRSGRLAAWLEHELDRYTLLHSGLHWTTAQQLPPMTIYAMSMIALAGCLDPKQFSDAKEDANKSAFTALYSELSIPDRWDQSEFQLKKLVNAFGGNQLIERVLESFDTLNEGWNPDRQPQ